jgi:hypothetical protein
MNLPEPVVGQEAGPQYAIDINAALTLIDGHNHSPGSGVLVTPNGLDINVDLPFGSNNATLLRSVRFTPQSSPLALPADLGAVYVSGVDLYYNDENGNQIRITQSGAVAGAPGSIGGLVAPASVTYNPLTQTFIFQSGVNTSGYLDSGPVTVRNNTVSSPGVTINPPVGLAAAYALFLPAALPSSTQLLTLSSTGQLAVTNTALPYIAAGSLTGSQLANGTVTSTQLHMQNITAGSTGSVNYSSGIGSTGFGTISITPAGSFVVLTQQEVRVSGTFTGNSGNFVSSVAITCTNLTTSASLGTRLVQVFITGSLTGWVFDIGQTMFWYDLSPVVGSVNNYQFTAATSVTANTSSSGSLTANIANSSAPLAWEPH